MKSHGLKILFLLISFGVFGQNRETKTAFEVYNSMEYSSAIKFLEKAFTVESDNRYQAEILFKLGMSYYNISDFKQAELQFSRAIKLDYGSEAEFMRAKMLMQQGLYDEAEIAFKEYSEVNPGDNRLAKILKSIELAKKISQEKSDYRLRNLSEVNTEFHDFAPSFFTKDEGENALVFTSTRLSENSKGIDKWLGTPFSNLYLTKLERKGADLLSEQSKWSQAQLFSHEINSPLHEGAACFSSDGLEMYFTRCDYDPEADSGCSIYYSKFVDGKWTEPVNLSQNLGSNVAGYPAISPDGKMLVYSANGPNSFGKKDLYMLTRARNGEWTLRPRNLGRRINTEENEVFPWFDQDGNLYFASDGHPGLGGLDVFFAQKTSNSWAGPINLKAPINSSSDDFALVFSADKSKGFISSNRPGGKGFDDIYEIRLLPLLYGLKGRVIDTNTGAELAAVLIRLEGNDGSVNFTSTNQYGEYSFDQSVINGGTYYKLILSVPKYLVQVASISTLGIPIELFQKVENGYFYELTLDVEMDHMADPIVLPHIEYDYNKANLRPESEESLSNLAEILEENPDVVIKLRAHTDHIGGFDFNMKLSQARAQSCVNFLISKGISPDRLVAEGLGETDPFVIPENLESSFNTGTVLTEDYIQSLSKKLEEEARQYNRRTDFKVIGEIVRRQVAIADSSVVESDVTQEIAVEIDSVIDNRSKVDQNQAQLFYVLVEGDNFGNVASKFNISVSDLRKLNGGLRAIQPFEGLKLKISLSADYTEFDSSHYQIQRSDNTFEKLLNSIKLDEDTFFELNPEFVEDNLRAGYLVRIK